MPKSYSIVGMEHQKADDFVKGLSAGVSATLVREPNNPFDPSAVAVWIEGRKIGFIPKKQNVVLARFIDQTGGNGCIDGEMALDKAIVAAGPDIKAISARFIRSPNSGYPMVEVVE
jgi:hypothetical protein